MLCTKAVLFYADKGARLCGAHRIARVVLCTKAVLFYADKG